MEVEVISKNLKKLMQEKEFKLFGMPRESPKLNHLAFVDDMIILYKDEFRTLQMVSNTLERYVKIFGQKINKEKSAIYLHKGISNRVGVMAEVATSILRKEFPFTYLGCPIFYMRKKKYFYQ